MIFRKMTEDDADLAAQLDKKCFSVPWSRQGFADALCAETNIFYGAFTKEGELLGYCGMYTAADEGEITNVAVDPKQRGRGLAKQLVGRTMQAALEKGVRQVFLEVRVSNLSAQAVYRDNGFVTCGIRKEFYRLPDEDALVMSYKRDAAVQLQKDHIC